MELTKEPINQVDLQTLIDQVLAIKNGPQVLQLYMDLCQSCGTCAEQCHVSVSNPSRRTNPAARSDLIRKVYKRYGSAWGKVLKVIGAAQDVTQDEVETWQRDFYECSGCRRCAKYCPFGIDNSVLTRKGRAIVHALGRSPYMMSETQRISDETGNDEGQPYVAFMEAVKFLQEEIKDEIGVDVRIPVDEDADILFIPASADLISFPETQMGTAVFFHAAGLSWTMSSEAFDGANFGLFTGDDPHMMRKNQLAYDACIKHNVKTLVIGECGHAYRIAKLMGPTASKNKNPFETTNIFLLAQEFLDQGKLKFDKSKIDFPVTYHDPCNFARSTGIYEEPRNLLNAMVSDFREMTPNRTENWCCGGGGGLAVMDGKEKVAYLESSYLDQRMLAGKKKVEQILATGATYVAGPCANCKRQLQQLQEHYKTGVTVGGVFDLMLKGIVLD